MENPQLENGFMRIANEIVDELFKLPLNERANPPAMLGRIV